MHALKHSTSANTDTRSRASSQYYSSEWQQIDQWLKAKYHLKAVPVFERTQEAKEALLELMQLNEAQDTHARQAIVALREVSQSYQREDTILNDNLRILGIRRDQLSTSCQETISDIADLAMLLGVSDTTLISFRQGFAQLRLDTLHHSRQQRVHQVRTNALHNSQQQAQAGLDRLLQLKQQLQERREMEGDIEQRTRRRSAELSRIRANEDQETLQRIQSRGVDVETQELTIAHLDSKQDAILELERQVEAQTKILAAYQDIPPDYMLAKLKLQEATLRLNDLTAEHESMLTQLADDL
ncbi:HAUS augmin-like complex subunit 1 [Mortierella claussenii]|nr:HAUS augmin-like complex subunit 1 [Mortierella claussenii]